jgi:hypothetical protein
MIPGSAWNWTAIKQSNLNQKMNKKMAMKTNYWFNRNRLLSGLRFIALLLACSAIAQSAIAVTPEPDGGYPNGNTAEEDNALLELNTGTPTPTPTASFPLKKSPNNRYLTDQNGTPFLLIGDSNWMSVAQFRNADIDTYLADRAAKGFNTILVQTIDTHFSDNAPNNIDGVAPFTVPNNFSTANPAFYTRFDYLLNRAATYGMVVVTFPLYTGVRCEKGWGQQMIASSTADLQTFGTFLGNRYKNKPNIIWVMAGDESPYTCGLETKVNAFATSLTTADPNHLVTQHNQGGEAVTPWLAHGPVPSWLTLNSTYGPSPLTFTQGQTAYNRANTRPFFMIESYYENMHSLSRKDVRSEAYWALLSGNCGYVFGNCPMWGAGSAVTHTKCPDINADWHLQLNSPGARDMTRLKNLFTSVAWHTLVPDFTHTTVTAGYGTGITTVTTSRASNGSFVMSYLPSLNRVTVNMTRLTGSSVVARWYDPSNGVYTTVAGSPFPNTGSRVFTPTGNNSSGASDWVLVLQSR